MAVCVCDLYSYELEVVYNKATRTPVKCEITEGIDCVNAFDVYCRLQHTALRQLQLHMWHKAVRMISPSQ